MTQIRRPCWLRWKWDQDRIHTIQKVKTPHNTIRIAFGWWPSSRFSCIGTYFIRWCFIVSWAPLHSIRASNRMDSKTIESQVHTYATFICMNTIDANEKLYFRRVALRPNAHSAWMFPFVTGAYVGCSNWNWKQLKHTRCETHYF